MHFSWNKTQTAFAAMFILAATTVGCGSSSSKHTDERPGVEETKGEAHSAPQGTSTEPGALAGTWKESGAGASQDESLTGTDQRATEKLQVSFSSGSAHVAFVCQIGSEQKTVELDVPAAFSVKAVYFLQAASKSEQVGSYSCGGSVDLGYNYYEIKNDTLVLTSQDGNQTFVR